MARINFATAGFPGRAIPAYAMQASDDPDPSAIQCIAHAIARKNKLDVVSVRNDGHSADSVHYEVTLGRRLKTGGYSVEAAGFVFVPKVG